MIEANFGERASNQFKRQNCLTSFVLSLSDSFCSSVGNALQNHPDAFGVALYRLGLSCSQYALQGADSVEEVGRSMEQLNIEISRG